MKKHQLNLSIDDIAWQRMGRMMNLSRSSSMLKMMRQSLVVYDELLRAVDAGGKILIRDSHGNDTFLVIVDNRLDIDLIDGEETP